MPGVETIPRYTALQGPPRKFVVVGAVDLARAKVRVRAASNHGKRIGSSRRLAWRARRLLSPVLSREASHRGTGGVAGDRQGAG